MKETSVLICGVGGQGILLASDLLGKVAIEAGLDAKKSEVHGMAQRGGAVVSIVRFGVKIYSPIIGENEADFILSFEILETLRQIKFLKKSGVCIVNNYKLPPFSVSTGIDKYPENIPEEIKKHSKEMFLINGLELAKEIGNSKTVNVILLGALAKRLDFPKECWIKTIKEHFPPKIIDINLKAFELGYNS
ncbi:MAG: indolepyruvate oxidoreductase subunit beta [bacterium]